MKILFTIANMVGGGSERVMASLANDFVARGHEVTILMTAGNEIAYELSTKVKTISIGTPTGGSLKGRVDRLVKMRKLFSRDRDQVIISFGTETNLFAILAHIGLKNKLIISERNDPNQCGYKLFRNMIYTMADSFVFQTEDAMKCFSKAIQRRSVVIGNPLKENLPDRFEGERRKEIVAVGRLTEQKNHALLLDAFAMFHKDFPDYQLSIYGKGELEESLKAKAKALALQECVVLKGFANDVLEQMKDCSMYVLSSDYEGISNSLAEAMSIGLPVVSTDCPIGGSKMCIENGVNGLLVPVKDATALYEAMKTLALDKEYADRMGRKASLIKEELSLQKLSEKWLCFCR